MTTPSPRRSSALLAAVSVLALGVAACSGEATTTSTTGTSAAAGAAGTSGASTGTTSTFPLTFHNADGSTTEIKAKPKRILSTSTSITGTLLAVGAPVVATAGDAKGNFFPQWASVAKERGVTNAWPAGSVDIEAATAAQPDLIIVSTSGADSAMKEIDQLRQVAPVITMDYGKQKWQDLATQVGQATGMPDEARKTIEDYDRYVAAAKSKITVPKGTAAIVSYNGPTDNNPIGMGSGPHADVLKELGFTIEEPDPKWSTTGQKRSDFVFAPYEALTKLTSPTVFLLAADEAKVAKFKADKVLANQPAVKSGQVYPLGKSSFRMDYYSAKQMVDNVVKSLGHP